MDGCVSDPVSALSTPQRLLRPDMLSCMQAVVSLLRAVNLAGHNGLFDRLLQQGCHYGRSARLADLQPSTWEIFGIVEGTHGDESK